jgi:uncharacterized protein YhbP (UPF0306 family)
MPKWAMTKASLLFCTSSYRRVDVAIFQLMVLTQRSTKNCKPPEASKSGGNWAVTLAKRRKSREAALVGANSSSGL